MFDILLVLQCLNGCMDSISLKRLKIIIPALLAIPGRVTMLAISRWTGEGGSYRSVQRFFNTTIDWKNVQWSLIRHYLLNSSDTFILAGDETVVTKSGKKTFGLDRFFSSLFGKPVPGLSIFAFSLVSTKWRISFPLMTKQMTRPNEETIPEKTTTKKN
jgi:putative transposase